MGIAAPTGFRRPDRLTFLNTEASHAAYTAAVQPLLDVYAGYNNGWFIMPLLAGGTNFLSSWLMQKGQPKNPQADGANKVMMWVFPLMSVWFCITYNASFAIYWTISSVCMIITNLVLNKKFPRGGVAVQEAKE